MTVCRVKGCVAFAAPAPSRPSNVYFEGICAVHQQYPEEDLRVLLGRDVGLVAPLQRITGRIEYERADGSCYGYDDQGCYYEAAGDRREP